MTVVELQVPPQDAETLDSHSERRRGVPGAVTVARLGRRLTAAGGASHVMTYSGVVVTLAGCALLLLGWVRIANLGQLWQQMPYLISAACSGLTLVIIGMAVINIGTKAADARRRQEQVEELKSVLVELRRAVEEQR